MSVSLPSPRIRSAAVVAAALLAAAPAARGAVMPAPGVSCAVPASGRGLALERDLGGGRRLCFGASAGVRLDASDGRLLALPPGGSLTVAVLGEAGSRSLRVSRVDGSALREWQVDGRPLPFDDAARAWMEEALAVVAGIREGDAIRAEAEGFRADLASLVESERRLRDEIGALLEERGRLERAIGDVRAEERELRERIASIRGEESALQVAAGDHRTAIASLAAELEEAEGARRDEVEAALTSRRAALTDVLERLRREDHPERIRALEERLAGLDTAERVSAIGSRIAALEVDERAAELEERIRRLQVRERSVALRRRLRHARDRLEHLRARLAPRIERLLTP